MARKREPQPTVQDLMKELILTEDLHSGDKLPTENELTERLGASRNAVREALRSLEALGIVEIRHGYGMYLRDATLAGLAETLTFWGRMSHRDGVEALAPIAELREVLETSLIGRVVGELTREDLRELSGLVRTMEIAAEEGKYASDEDRRFHEVLYRPLGNWVFTYLLQAFWDAYTELDEDTKGSRNPPEDVAQCHRDLLEALKRRDRDAAATAMSRHFDNFLRRPRSAG